MRRGQQDDRDLGVRTSMIRAVIFDFNGVLVDDESVHCDLFREVLAAEGVAMDERLYHEKYLGFDDRECFETAMADAGLPVDRAKTDEMIARKAVRYFEVAEAGLRFFPKAAESLATLSDHWPLAINSGALRPEIEFALGKMGVRDRIRAIVSAEDASRGKPDPMGYLLALEALRREPGMADLAAGDCLVIEDSLAGILSARGAGMLAVGIAQTYGREELSGAGAEAVIDDLHPLTPSWIDRTFGGKS
ncbi:HAD family hydrolase [Tundrisphaera lichenicola]|uniref:HAD family hydrolase n=1 Tax=Tundrisphaera lichenicola TaxID=2029860 RepID=UPI003EBEF809